MDRRTEVVIVGGGHNGLAMSKQLADRGIDHVVLERDEVASSWRRQRWDSFTLLTPSTPSGPSSSRRLSDRTCTANLEAE